MLALTPATRIFVAVAPVDLRRGFDGLCAHVQSVLEQQVVEGGLFVFHQSAVVIGFVCCGLTDRPLAGDQNGWKPVR